ncbi:hypothetical protein AMTRI_Chr10g7700 [Amborella trichopoda]|uniref:RING-type domain-containing protein n=1 Tax=Amborella trichopoda TaxID=13333 RepID=U5DCN4_AMBTC|nr:probable E3 ubiquitin-protein ligase XERICO [Amborella trichopoda]ERN19177.1 hypothetical protein AMTR_s00061p00174460 [Amborella trichopoda]|eukprot:XP_006857710.1 probable E3 ubiquitin-protein ligase XERICO [Amborella trichopoda]
MGLSSLPAPSEGVLSILVVNAVLSITLIKEILRSVLHVVGLRPAHSPESSDLPDVDPFPPPQSELFRHRIPAMPYFTVRRDSQENECPVCLSPFEPNARVSQLACGHVFHKACLDKWLDYWHSTCPLCRYYLGHGDTGRAWF